LALLLLHLGGVSCRAKANVPNQRSRYITLLSRCSLSRWKRCHIGYNSPAVRGSKRYLTKHPATVLVL